ncbi:hypothetical protein RB195_008609 [Necator americanus]|uniref:Uncharacterized protein n=1 Tax=Necator americanus TaxID=51031 RepID=A0ABR1CPF6_NECAM
MNCVRGNVQVVCNEEGIEFCATTLFPFTATIFNEKKRVPGVDVIGQYFSWKDSVMVTVTGDRYAEMLKTFLCPTLGDLDSVHMWLQLDGATASLYSTTIAKSVKSSIPRI